MVNRADIDHWPDVDRSPITHVLVATNGKCVCAVVPDNPSSEAFTAAHVHHGCTVTRVTVAAYQARIGR